MLVFIDESGYPRPSDDNAYSTLVAVCIYENDIRNISRALYQLKDSIYGKQDEIKSTNVIRRQTLEKNRTNNKLYAEKFVEITTRSNISVFGIIMKRPVTAPIKADGILPKQYQLLMKKIEYFAERKDVEKAIFVFDETNEGDDLTIAQEFNGFLFRSRLGKSFTKILETPLFVSSKVTPAIQIADIFAGIIRHYYQNELHMRQPETDFELWLSMLYERIAGKTENYLQPNGKFYEYGLQYVENLNYIRRNKDGASVV
ncbi:MAG: DUF3800 domain-containing protein [Clostridia bacterium]|nr:DUF3800 domain-containing protein [Clostridia bacterium]